MANAPHDQNAVKAKLGILFSDGITLVPIAINPIGNGVMVNTTDTVSSAILALYTAGKAIPRDANNQPAWCGQSSTNSAVIYPIFVDANGAVLIET